jgi:hypothetical protein
MGTNIVAALSVATRGALNNVSATAQAQVMAATARFMIYEICA